MFCLLIFFYLAFVFVHTGNDNLHILTNRRAYTVRFDLMDFTGDTAYAEYTVFIVADVASKYRMINGGYSGTADKVIMC